MKTVFGATVMTLGVALMSWDLYCIYHHMPLSVPAFIAGMVLAGLGARWVQGEMPRPI